VKVIWSVILLAAVVLAIASAYFFGHALSVHEKAKWFGFSAICLVLSVALLFAIVRFDRHTPDATHHH
jgi:uncharacterized membrane protein YhdT